MVRNSTDLSVETVWKLRALLRTSTFTNLLVARLLRLESVVDRLEKETEVWEIVKPIRPPRCDVIEPCSGHSCSNIHGQHTRFPLRPWHSNIPRFCGKRRKNKNRRDFNCGYNYHGWLKRKFFICHDIFRTCLLSTPVPIVVVCKLLSCATTNKIYSLSKGRAFVPETRDRVTLWTFLLTEKAWQPFFIQGGHVQLTYRK